MSFIINFSFTWQADIAVKVGLFSLQAVTKDSVMAEKKVPIQSTAGAITTKNAKGMNLTLNKHDLFKCKMLLSKPLALGLIF